MSSSPAANPQHEPTMEEILASIRKIISEDQPEGVKSAAPQPAPLRAVEPVAEPELAPEPAAEAEVLELTEELPEEEPEPIAPAPPAPVAMPDNDIDFAPEPAIAAAPSPEADDLISDTTRSAVGYAFASINKGPDQGLSFAGASLETIFVQAVQGAFQPTLKDWVEGNRTEIMNAMKPLIRAWMDEHLPPLIEAAIAKEIARAAGETLRKSDTLRKR